MYAKRSSVTRCETRPRLVRNSLRNSSFRMRKIFLREAPWLFRASVAKGPAGACVELLALLGPTRSVVVEAPLRFLPLSQAVVLSLLSHVSNGRRRMGEVRHTRKSAPRRFFGWARARSWPALAILRRMLWLTTVPFWQKKARRARGGAREGGPVLDLGREGGRGPSSFI